MPAMPRPRPSHLQRSVSRHGKVVWYVRIGRGPKIRVRGEYGSDEFNEHYRAAVAGDKPTPRGAPAKDTLAWLLDLHRKSGYWAELAPATRKQREVIYRQVTASAGKYRLATIDKQAIVDGRDKRRSTPSQARHFVNSMRYLFKWAVDSNLVKVDPTQGVTVKKPKKSGYKPWTDEDISKFEAHWQRGTRERVIFDLFVYTGFRIGDLAGLGRQHIRNGTLMIDTEKNGTRVTLPILAPLAETLKAGPTGDLAFVASPTGRPIKKGRIGDIFHAACVAAGVDKSGHGIRKAAATHAANQGATVHELEAIFGWSGGQMAALYTKEANRKALAEGAIGKLDRKPMLPPRKKVVATGRKT